MHFNVCGQDGGVSKSLHNFEIVGVHSQCTSCDVRFVRHGLQELRCQETLALLVGLLNNFQQEQTQEGR